jgi:acetyl-CoA carboxylase biotin carboxyl carrier protein
MDLKYIKQLIRLVERSEINELELDDSGTRIKIVKSQSIPAHPVVANPVHQVVAAQIQAPATPAAEKASKKEETNLYEVISPMVGTFYRAPSPGAPPFVEVGDRVVVGQTLCILEAMKLMNELENEVNGRIVEICVENAQPVEFGHRLFLIAPEGK